ncbi:hypothetical protein AAGG42_18785, partial [Stenotrophomonas maltophilia]
MAWIYGQLRLLVGVDLGRHRASAASDPLLLFFFFSVVGRAQETVKGRAGWVCRTVGAMDGAIEPPWMGLR